ncbi:hypothetical protein [Pedobacter heparinus]|uniref:hypothetical protein n=1 Tax=Pedobacter heparinus TaxID=984 RepID=UPI00292F8887|nr:hypothetical protein [Pedobacter heparinus]
MNTGIDTNSTSKKIIVNFDHLGIEEIVRLEKYSNNKIQTFDGQTNSDIMGICYLDKGSQIYEVGDAKYALEGEDIFIIFPNELYSTLGKPKDKSVLYLFQIKIAGNGRFLGFNDEEASFFETALLNIPSRLFKGSLKSKEILDELLGLAIQPYSGFLKIKIRNLTVQFLLDVLDCAANV